MINFESLFSISYGLYIVSSGNSKFGNGYISNTFFQVTAEPPQFAASCNKDNFTAQLIESTGSFAVSVLHTEVHSELIGKFGYKSGREINKLKGMNIKYGITGVPIIIDDAISFLECKVIQILDVGTHLIFIGELLQADFVNKSMEPITYDHYRKVRKGLSPKNAPTYIDKSKLQKAVKSSYKKFQCPACGYIYDEELGDPENGIALTTKFDTLDDEWTCPACGSLKEDFFEI